MAAQGLQDRWGPEWWEKKPRKEIDKGEETAWLPDGMDIDTLGTCKLVVIYNSRSVCNIHVYNIPMYILGYAPYWAHSS